MKVVPRAIVIVAVVIVAVVAGSACGGGSSAHVTAGPLTPSAIARATTSAGSARLTLHRSGPATSGAPAAATGEVDFAHGRGVADGTAAGGLTYEIRWIGPRTYVREPTRTGTAGGSATQRWVAAGPGLGDTISVDPSNGFLFTSDPLAAIRLNTVDLVTVRHESVGGVATTRLHGTLQLDALARRLRSLGYTVDDPSSQAVPIDIWVDAQRRLRRVVVPSGDGSSGTFTVDLSDYGVRVDVQPPPANEIAHGESSSSGSSSATAVPPTHP